MFMGLIIGLRPVEKGQAVTNCRAAVVGQGFLTKKRRYQRVPPVYASISGGNSSCDLGSAKCCGATIYNAALPLCAERM